MMKYTNRIRLGVLLSLGLLGSAPVVLKAAPVSTNSSAEELIQFAEEGFKRVLNKEATLKQVVDELMKMNPELGKIVSKVLQMFIDNPELMDQNETVRKAKISWALGIKDSAKYRGLLNRLVEAFRKYDEKDLKRVLRCYHSFEGVDMEDGLTTAQLSVHAAKNAGR